MTDSSDEEALFCGVDPGRDKFGVALTDGENLFFSAVIPLCELDCFVKFLLCGSWEEILKWRAEGKETAGRIRCVFLGGGTGSELFEKKLREVGVPCSLVDESMTTLEGRALYWSLHPPGGLWRLVPTSLRVPPRAVDDLAAWAIAKRAISRFSPPIAEPIF